MGKSPYRLFWFQHFHKAAGTSIYHTAKDNRLSPYPKNANGNPLDSNSELIPLWQFSGEELLTFVDTCENTGVGFVSTELALPNIEALSHDPRVTLITCFRDPLKRFLSNYYFDLYNGYSTAKTMEEYASQNKAPYAMDNYYCRILSGHGADAEPIEEDLYTTACHALKFFAHTFILEKGLVPLCKSLNWKPANRKLNRSSFDPRQTAALLSHGNLKPLYRRILLGRTRPSDGFTNQFKLENKWDYKIYHELFSGA